MLNICPVGYRVPERVDFEKLIAHFGGEDIDADKIINSYVRAWNGNPNGDGKTNVGSGLYWTNTSGTTGKYNFYFRTIDHPWVDISSLSSASGKLHIRCLKK